MRLEKVSQFVQGHREAVNEARFGPSPLGWQPILITTVFISPVLLFLVFDGQALLLTVSYFVLNNPAKISTCAFISNEEKRGFEPSSL